MKNAVFTTLFFLIFSSSVVATEFTLKSSKTNNESQLCIDAATGNQTIAQIAKAIGVSEDSIDRNITCNGVGISKFAKQYTEKHITNTSITTEKNFSLSAKNSSENSQLCVVAASGDFDKFQRVVRSQGMNVKYVVKYTKCNGMSVVNFVNKYGSEQTANLLQSKV